MAVLNTVNIEKAFGDKVVLKGCTMTIEAGDRVGLVGVNGSGKSTFLKIIALQMSNDAGRVEWNGNYTLLDQNPVLPGPTVDDAAQDALIWHSELLQAYTDALEAGEMDEAGQIQARLDDVGWEVRHRIDALLDQVAAPPKEALVSTLSGGEIRRVGLARALLSAPDLLILDEPTNHLDARTVEWLQSFLMSYRGAVLLVTHDRYLLEAVANRIVEIEDGRTVSYEGSYTDYLLERAERMASQESAHHRQMQLIAREAAWASRSPAARTGKQKARLNRLSALNKTEGFRSERAMQLDLKTGLKTGRAVLELYKVAKGYDSRTLFRDFTLNIAAGDRIGILGPNGCGKSTMLSIISGEIEPDQGEIRKSPRFRVAVLNQNREGLDPKDTLYEAAGGGSDYVVVGETQIHVASFLRRFLFERQSFDQRVSTLSGGEQARLLMARLLLQGCNLLLLDEPTNDLDLQTLRVLEDALLSFDGAMIVITHDRAFMDRVCSRILSFEEGDVVEYADRLQVIDAEKRRQSDRERSVRAAKKENKRVSAVPQKVKLNRLSFNEKRELDGFPSLIEELEQRKQEMELVLADPVTYRDRSDDVLELTRSLGKLEREIESAYERWESLTARAEG